MPRVAPCVPVAVAADLAQARRLAARWVAFYVTSMGPLCPRTLRRLGHGPLVEEVLAANPDRGTRRGPRRRAGAPRRAHRVGRRHVRRAALERWYAVGAELPVLALPPNRPVAELDYMIESLAPAAVPAGAPA